jgi:hypothetical protein
VKKSGMPCIAIQVVIADGNDIPGFSNPVKLNSKPFWSPEIIKNKCN